MPRKVREPKVDIEPVVSTGPETDAPVPLKTPAPDPIIVMERMPHEDLEQAYNDGWLAACKVIFILSLIMIIVKMIIVTVRKSD